jgi:hypothetical protein
MSTRLFATSTKMPNPLGMLTFIMFSFVLGGCHMGLFFEVGLHELSNWFNFWHFHVKQWGGFMVHVSTSSELT